MAYALEALGVVHAQGHRFAVAYPECAAQLFGAADALFRLVNLPITSSNQGFVTILQQPARDRLGLEGYAAAYAAGQALSLEAVLDLIERTSGQKLSTITLLE